MKKETLIKKKKLYQGPLSWIRIMAVVGSAPEQNGQRGGEVERERESKTVLRDGRGSRCRIDEGGDCVLGHNEVRGGVA